MLYIVILHSRIAYRLILADAVALDRRRDDDSHAHRQDCTATSHKTANLQESSRARGARLLAEDLACLHDVLEGHKVLNAPVQPDLAASRRGVRL